MKKLLLLLALAIVCSTANAQLLWKISGNGLTRDSYLLGTHHVAPAAMIDSIKGLTEAIKSVDAIYGEVALDEMQSPNMAELTMKYYIAPADSTLDKVFEKSQYDSINALISQYTNGMASLDQLSSFKPAAVSAQLGVLQSMKAFPGFDPSKQLDTYVQALAKQEGKPAKGFETLEFQLDLLFGDPISEQAKSLMKAVRLDKEAIVKAQELAKAYVSGNLDKIEALMLDEQIGLDEESAEKMLYSRNYNWEKLLLGILPSASIMVAVGAGHLPGDKGLINLLRKSGYTVTPVK